MGWSRCGCDGRIASGPQRAGRGKSTTKGGALDPPALSACAGRDARAPAGRPATSECGDCVARVLPPRQQQPPPPPSPPPPGPPSPLPSALPPSPPRPGPGPPYSAGAARSPPRHIASSRGRDEGNRLGPRARVRRQVSPEGWGAEDAGRGVGVGPGLLLLRVQLGLGVDAAAADVLRPAYGHKGVALAPPPLRRPTRPAPAAQRPGKPTSALPAPAASSHTVPAGRARLTSRLP